MERAVAHDQTIVLQVLDDKDIGDEKLLAIHPYKPQDLADRLMHATTTTVTTLLLLLLLGTSFLFAWNKADTRRMTPGGVSIMTSVNIVPVQFLSCFLRRWGRKRPLQLQQNHMVLETVVGVWEVMVGGDMMMHCSGSSGMQWAKRL